MMIKYRYSASICGVARYFYRNIRKDMGDMKLLSYANIIANLRQEFYI